MRSKSAILNVFFNLVLQILLVVYGFVIPKIIISNYGSNINGLIVSISQFLAYISLLDSGFSAVVKSLLYKPIANNDKRTIQAILKSSDILFKRIGLIFILYVIIIAFLYPFLINNSFDFIFTFILIIILSISTLTEYYFGMVYKIYLEAEQKKYIISLIQIITYLLIIIVTVILSKLNVSIITLKVVTCALFVVRPFIQNIYVKHKYDINFSKINDKYDIKNKWDGLAQHIASVIHTGTDVTLLSLFSTMAEVSVYSVYSMVTSGIRSIIVSFIGGIDSSFGDMIAKNEISNLNDKFNIYEVLYDNIVTILYSCALVQIIPFVSIYTSEIKDANYIRELFGTLLLVAGLIWSMRQPYNELIKAAGRFKETRKSAWIECFLNILISFVLIFQYGIIGITIGTIISLFVRGIDLLYQSNKFILKRRIIYSVQKIILSTIEIIIIIAISSYLPLLSSTNYTNWIINSFIITILSLFVVIVFDFLFYRNEVNYYYNLMKKTLFKIMRK